jgi:hypothetical protein
MNGMLWRQGWQRTAMFRMAFLRHPAFQGISASLHVNGMLRWPLLGIHAFAARRWQRTAIYDVNNEIYQIG